MGVNEILSQIDREIAQLKQARALLGGASTHQLDRHTTSILRTRKKRNLTPEGRKRIAEAVRRRWARQKGASTQVSKN